MTCRCAPRDDGRVLGAVADCRLSRLAGRRRPATTRSTRGGKLHDTKLHRRCIFLARLHSRLCIVTPLVAQKLHRGKELISCMCIAVDATHLLKLRND